MILSTIAKCTSQTLCSIFCTTPRYQPSHSEIHLVLSNRSTSLLLLLLLPSKPLYETNYQVSSFNRALLMVSKFGPRYLFQDSLLSEGVTSVLVPSCWTLPLTALTLNILGGSWLFNQRNWTRLCQWSAFIIKCYTSSGAVHKYYKERFNVVPVRGLIPVGLCTPSQGPKKGNWEKQPYCQSVLVCRVCGFMVCKNLKKRLS